MTTDQLGLIQLGDITPSKKAAELLAIQIANGVNEGSLDPIDTAIHLNAIKKVCEEALGKIVDPVLANLVNKRAEKWGCKVEQAEVGVKYDYSQNPAWVELKEKEEKIAEDRKGLESLLKVIPPGKEVFAEDGTQLIGAAKTSTTLFKVTLAK